MQLASNMDAQQIAIALGGYRSGANWVACCPAHDDRRPSLSLTDTDDGRVLVHCHAGCDGRNVISELKSRGLWPSTSMRNETATQLPRPKPANDNERRTAQAMEIWKQATPAPGSLVEKYLNERRLLLPPPQSLRFHPGLKHQDGGTWPAMVALVTDGRTNHPMAVHRTYLTHDGRAKAPLASPKMMLGPCRGGAVRLGVADRHTLLVGEGIETCLAAMIATGLPAWAALSTSGLRGLNFPDDIRSVTILSDGDSPGKAAANDAAQRWLSTGRSVRIAHPTDGMDFNDMLLREAA